jgi:hypothetical protein
MDRAFEDKNVPVWPVKAKNFGNFEKARKNRAGDSAWFGCGNENQ